MTKEEFREKYGHSELRTLADAAIERAADLYGLSIRAACKIAFESECQGGIEFIVMQSIITHAESLESSPSYTCPICNMTSYHPEDVKHGYCGRCHAFTAGAGRRQTKEPDSPK